MNQPPPLYLGWDVGGTKCAVVVGTAEGQILSRCGWETRETRGPETMIATFERYAQQLAQEHGTKFQGLGVSIGGPLNMKSGEIIAPPHLPGWNNIPLPSLLAQKLTNILEHQAPIRIVHDAAACLLAEYRWGAAQGMTDAIYLTCGTGFGSGIMIDSKILMGPHGESPEIGDIPLSDTGPQMLFAGLPRAGHAEGFCSGTGLPKLAHFLFPNKFPLELSGAEIAALATKGSQEAQAVLDECACRTAQVCVVLSAIFSPQIILLGSLARYLGPTWVDTIRREFSRRRLPSNALHTRVEPTELTETLQDLSTIAAAMYQKN
jgi:glucokinase